MVRLCDLLNFHSISGLLYVYPLYPLMGKEKDQILDESEWRLQNLSGP